MQGLEVKVRLGSVWKQSLTELSGGQRYVLADIVFYQLLTELLNQFIDCTISHHGPSPIQARSHVYFG